MDDLQQQIDVLKIKNAALKGALSTLILHLGKTMPDLSKAYREVARTAIADNRVESINGLEDEIDNLFLSLAAIADSSRTL